MKFRFAELCAISNFSFLQGSSHPEEMVTTAAQLGYEAIALADSSTVSGIVRAHISAKNLNIQFIPATRLTLLNEIPDRNNFLPEYLPYETLAEEDNLRLPFDIITIPTSRDDYSAMTSLLTLGKMRAAKGRCWITTDDLKFIGPKTHIIILPRRAHPPVIKSFAQQMKNLFAAEKLSLAIWPSSTFQDHNLMSAIAIIAKETKTHLLATNNPLYHTQDRKNLLDILTCTRHKATLADAGYLLQENSERYLRNKEELARLFKKFPSSVNRSIEIAEAATNFSLADIHYEYPAEVCPDGQSPLDFLKATTIKEASDKYPEGIPEKVFRLLEKEFSLIGQLHYAKYFLTVYHIIKFARSRGILCQGRGAAANSAVCYCLGITAVDPEKIDLLLERFISLERNEPPDIDIDFEHERREEVIQYIYNTFGRSRAALVCEVVTYRTKSAITDIGKAFALSSETIQELIQERKHSTNRQLDITQDTSGNLNVELGLSPSNPTAKSEPLCYAADCKNKVFFYVDELIGFPRHLSQHVGGFVVCDFPLSSIVPIENAAMPGRTVIEWDKDDIDHMGMMKIDILALGMLTCIRKCFAVINNKRLPHQQKLQLDTIPGDDSDVYDMICAADTIGVFQIESRAQMSILPKVRPRCFYDLVVQVAIVRPGPIQGGIIHPYIRRRQGREKATVPDKRVAHILNKTLGVPIFQEQIMQLAVVAAGFTPGEADELRRALASWKKKKGKVAEMARRIYLGMRQRNYSDGFARQVLSYIRGFAEYGFPQSHAASFSLLVYVSAWLKHHYPEVFAASILNSMPMGFYGASQIIADAKRHSVQVLPVDIIKSEWGTSIPKRFQLRLGMHLVRNMRIADAEKIIAKRDFFRLSNKPEVSIKNIWRAADVSTAALKNLAKADAFADMGISRQVALWEIGKLTDRSLPLFDWLAEKNDNLPQEVHPTKVLPSFSSAENIMLDYQALSIHLKAHPLSLIRQSLKQNNYTPSNQLPETKHGTSVKTAGLVIIKQQPPTASGVAFLTIEDEYGLINLILKPETYNKYHNEIAYQGMIAAEGTLQSKDSVINIVVGRISRLRESAL